MQIPPVTAQLCAEPDRTVPSEGHCNLRERTHLHDQKEPGSFPFPTPISIPNRHTGIGIGIGIDSKPNGGKNDVSCHRKDKILRSRFRPKDRDHGPCDGAIG